MEPGERVIVAAALAASEAREEAQVELPVERTLGRASSSASATSRPFDATRRPTGGDGALAVIAADFVTLDAGTGIVHIAPAFGEDDFQRLRASQAARASLQSAP